MQSDIIGREVHISMGCGVIFVLEDGVTGGRGGDENLYACQSCKMSLTL